MANPLYHWAMSVSISSFWALRSQLSGALKTPCSRPNAAVASASAPSIGAKYGCGPPGTTATFVGVSEAGTAGGGSRRTPGEGVASCASAETETERHDDRKAETAQMQPFHRALPPPRQI